MERIEGTFTILWTTAAVCASHYLYFILCGVGLWCTESSNMLHFNLSSGLLWPQLIADHSLNWWTKMSKLYNNTSHTTRSGFSAWHLQEYFNSVEHAAQEAFTLAHCTTTLCTSTEPASLWGCTAPNELSVNSKVCSNRTLVWNILLSWLYFLLTEWGMVLIS